MRQTSLVIRISLALAGIVALAMATMVTSYWISDRADSDAYAINLAGSLRMQTYRLGLLAGQADADAVAQTQARLAQTWESPIFIALKSGNRELAEGYRNAYDHWQQLEPVLLADNGGAAQKAALDHQVELIDRLVAEIQRHTENSARLLRLVQVSALFAILVLAAIVIYWLRIRVEQPLSQLTGLARRVGQGDYAGRAALRQRDELGILADTFNRMSDAISHMHQRMEERIEEQTLELQRSNTTLHFLYDIAKTIIEHEHGNFDFQPIVSRLIELVEAEDIELCLITETGDTPYRQIKPEHNRHELCMLRNCGQCLSGEPITDSGDANSLYRYSFPLMREQQHYGVLVCRMTRHRALQPWQQQLLQSVADQLALALSLEAQEDNARRLSLAHERTVIARELHDSLAQALSYLKIQVTRLNRALAADDKATLEDVSTELGEGLGSAYRQLRELLTTFRLKVDGPGLLDALQSSAAQLGSQSGVHIEMDYQLKNLPFTPNEEIHLLQIVREATQNAVRHSGGDRVAITLRQDGENRVLVAVEDNGRGMPEKPDRLNHYGLAIMQERSKNLGGRLDIRNRPGGGAGVYFTFMPDCLKQRSVVVQEIEG